MAAVLVVDDDPLVRELIRAILEAKGYSVLLASNGIDGLLLYSSYHARLDAVLTDLEMPQMGGLELAARIHTINPSMKIVLITGSGLSEVPEYCGLVSKPFRPEDLLATLSSHS
jgi:CheY-like chemotaxis protein